MKTVKFIVITTMVTALALTGCKNRYQDTGKLLQEMAQEVNKMCPMMVDNVTRWDNCMAVETNLIYNYTLNVSAADVNIEQLAATMLPAIVNGIKTSPDMAELRKRDVTFMYRYRDSEGNVLWELNVTPDMYK